MQKAKWTKRDSVTHGQAGTLNKVDDPVRGTFCGLHLEERHSISFNYNIGNNSVMNVQASSKYNLRSVLRGSRFWFRAV